VAATDGTVIRLAGGAALGVTTAVTGRVADTEGAGGLTSVAANGRGEVAAGIVSTAS
jgi:hypothetical protein